MNQIPGENEAGRGGTESTSLDPSQAGSVDEWLEVVDRAIELAGEDHVMLGTDFDVLGQARIVGVIIVEALHLYPIIYLNATASLADVNAEGVIKVVHGLHPVNNFAACLNRRIIWK